MRPRTPQPITGGRRDPHEGLGGRRHGRPSYGERAPSGGQAGLTDGVPRLTLPLWVSWSHWRSRIRQLSCSGVKSPRYRLM